MLSNQQHVNGSLESVVLPRRGTGFVREAMDASAWTVAPLWLCCDEEAPLSGNALFNKILKLGGKLAVLPMRGQADVSLLLKPLVETYGQERVRILPFAGHEKQEWIWPHDMCGLWLRGAEDKLQHLVSDYDKGCGASWSKAVQAGGFEQNRCLLEMKWDAGFFVFPDDRSLITTSKFFDKNPRLTPHDLLKNLSSTGVDRLIVLPPIDHQLGHADVIVSEINGKLVVPEIDARVVSGLSNAKDFHSLILTYQSIRSQLEKVGYEVVSIPTPLPLMPFVLMVSPTPVNMRLIRGQNGDLNAIVPWPKDYYIEAASLEERRYDWYDKDLFPEYQQQIVRSLNSLGVKQVEFIACDTGYSGAVHCLTAEIPDEVVQKLTPFTL